RPGPWYDDRAFGDDERMVPLWSDDRALRQVVDWRRPRDDRAGGENGAPLDHRAFVHAAGAADHDVVFDDHRKGADRLEHAADLRRGTDVDACAHLRARSDERVRVDERLLADPGADVDVHRRHADHAASEIGAVADAGSAGDDPDA